MTRPSTSAPTVAAPAHVATPPDPRAELTARLALGLLVLLAVARAVLTVTPTMHAWGLNFARFASPWPVWALWLAMAAALLPAVTRAVVAAGAPLARAFVRRPLLAYGCAVALALALLVGLPDRTGFVGDFLLRVGILAEPGGFARMFPQAMPLDSLLHWWLPRELARLTHGDAGAVAYVTGLLEGALVAVLAVRFALTLELGGAARLTAGALVLFSSYLGLYTGYGKPTIEVALLALGTGVVGCDVVRRGRGLVLLGALVALAPMLHRAALGIVPGALVAWLMWLRLHGGAGGWRRPAFLVSLALPLIALAWLLPRLIQLYLGFDASVNFASPEVARQGGVLRAALAPLRLLDLANLLLLYVPLAPVAILAAARHARPLLARREGVFLAGLSLGFLPLVLLTQVTQGPFRDWDAFAGAGAAAALLAAWCVARMLDAAPRYAWLALPLALAAAVPTVDVMLCQQDMDRGLARARAFIDEPPHRSEAHRLATLDFIGMRSLRAWRWSDAAATYEQLAETAPHPRALLLWGTAAVIAGEDLSAQRAFRSWSSARPISRWAGSGCGRPRPGSATPSPRGPRCAWCARGGRTGPRWSRCACTWRTSRSSPSAWRPRRRSAEARRGRGTARPRAEFRERVGRGGSGRAGAEADAGDDRGPPRSVIPLWIPQGSPSPPLTPSARSGRLSRTASAPWSPTLRRPTGGIPWHSHSVRGAAASSISPRR